MATVVWKCVLNRPGRTHLYLAKGAVPLTAFMQGRSATMWYEVDSAEPDCETRLFIIVGTGTPVSWEHTHRWVATFPDGPYIWHLYELLP